MLYHYAVLISQANRKHVEKTSTFTDYCRVMDGNKLLHVCPLLASTAFKHVVLFHLLVQSYLLITYI